MILGLCLEQHFLILLSVEIIEHLNIRVIISYD